MIRAVIFDLDNTLTDFMKMKDGAIMAAVAAMIDMGLPLSTDEARRRIYAIYDREGIEYQRVFDHLLREVYDSPRPDVLAAGIIGYRRVRDSQLVLYPHVTPTLVALLRRGIRLLVLSDAPSLQAWQRLHHLALQHVFEHVITFDDTGERKPSPAPFRRAMELLGLPAEALLMVGDWPERDMKGAAACGIRTVYARYGDTSGALRSGADFEIDDIGQLLDIVDRLGREQS
ncbi:MAG: HAD-IA family hydrolase [Candidatus Eisenbacteria bacterium]